RIGEGWPRSFTTDGSAVLAVVPTQPARLTLYPTGAGNERRVATPFSTINDAGWVIPDSTVYVCGNDAAKASSCLVENLNGSQTENSAEFTRATAQVRPSPNNPLHVSPDGRSVAHGGAAGYTVVDVATGAMHTLVRLRA